MRHTYPILVLVVASLSMACSFESRSEAYACPVGNECQNPRTCVEGWCVLSNAQQDAASRSDAFVCPSQCDRCNDDRCIFDCDEVGSCDERVVCPAGLPCKVNCEGVDSCAGGVDCSRASDCNVDCEGPDSCAQLVLCGTGACDLDCDGPDSCAGGLDCSSACQCSSSCQNDVCENHMCPGGNACSSSEGCDDGPASCRTCD